MSSSLHPPATILKVYVEDLTGLSHVHSPEGLNNPLFPQGCMLDKTAPSVGVLGKTYTERTGAGMGILQSPQSSSQANGRSHAPDEFPQPTPLSAKCLLVFQYATEKSAYLPNFS